MPHLNIQRVNTLPGVLAASTMYIVKGANATAAEIYFTNSDASETRHTLTAAEVTTMISSTLSSFNNIQVVADIAARDVLTAAADRNVMVLVLDASDDATVTSGAALYVYDEGTTTTTKVSEYESMDVTLTWAALQDKPTSSVAAIDAAVAASHTHANSAQLAKIGEDGDGQLTYNGAAIKAGLQVADW